MPAEENQKKKEPITNIGKDVPTNLKFGLIVAVAIFWADLVRSILNSIFSFFNINSQVVSDFILAIAVTVLAYIVLKSYSRLKSWLQKVKV